MSSDNNPREEKAELILGERWAVKRFLEERAQVHRHIAGEMKKLRDMGLPQVETFHLEMAVELEKLASEIETGKHFQ